MVHVAKIVTVVTTSALQTLQLPAFPAPLVVIHAFTLILVYNAKVVSLNIF